MARNPFIVEMETLLRVNMLFNWLRRDYGEVNDFNVSRLDVEDVWCTLLGPGFFPYPHHTTGTLKFYIQKENDFWQEMKELFVEKPKRIKY